MNIKDIMDFYSKNGLFQSRHTYQENIKHLEWFYQYD